MVNWSMHLTVTILANTEGTSELPTLSGLPTTGTLPKTSY
jgi:hypothetical protein